MRFGEAIELMNQGKRVKRAHWGGYWFKTDVMFNEPGEDVDTSKLPPYAANLIMAKLKDNGGYVPATAYQEDMQADDWEELAVLPSAQREAEKTLMYQGEEVPGHIASVLSGEYNKSLFNEFVETFKLIKIGRKTTICAILCKNGFEIIGTSSALDVKKFDKKLGERYAFVDALNKLDKAAAYYRQNKMNGGSGIE